MSLRFFDVGPGGPAEVFWHQGRIFLPHAVIDGASAFVQVYVYEATGARVGGAIWRASRGSWPCGRSALGAWWLLYKDEDERATLRRDGVVVWRSPHRCGGNHCLAIGSLGFVDTIAYQREGDNSVFALTLVNIEQAAASGGVDSREGAQIGVGAADGLSRLSSSDGLVLWKDDYGSVPGVTAPSRAGLLTAGEHSDAGVLVQYYDRQLRVWPAAVTYTPRLAEDRGTYAVTTWNKGGVLLATFTIDDLVVPVPVEPDAPWPPGRGWTRRDDITEIDVADYLLGAEWSRDGMHVAGDAVTYSHPFQARRGSGWVQHTKFAPPDTRAATWTITEQWIGLAFDGTNELSSGYRMVLPGTTQTAALYPRRMQVGPQHRRVIDLEILDLKTQTRRAVTFAGWVEAVYDGPQIGDIPPTTHAVIVFDPASTDSRGWREQNIGAQGLGCWYWHQARKAADSTPDMRWVGTKNTTRVVDPTPFYADAQPVLAITPPVHPPTPPEPPVKIWAYNDADAVRVIDFLELKYLTPVEQNGLGRTEVDKLGIARWNHDAIRLLDGGRSVDATLKEINRRINAIVGLPADAWPGVETPSVPETPAPTVPSQPPAGALRRKGRVLYDDQGARLLLSTTMMQATTLLEHEPELFADNLAASAEHQIDEWRIGGVVNWPQDIQDELPTEPMHTDKIREVIRLCWSRGVRTDLCVFLAQSDVPGLESLSACLDYTRRLCRAVADYQHATRWTVANEPGDTRVWRLGLDGLRAVARVIREELPSALIALGAPWHPRSNGTCEWTEGSREDGENALPWFGEASGCDIISPHYGRTGNERRDARQPWLGRRDSSGTECVMNNEEPIGPFNYYRGDGSLSNLNEQRPEVLGMEMTAAWMQGHAITTWHTGAGIGYQRLARRPAYFALREMPGLAHVAAAKAILPGDLPGFRFANWHWSLDQGQLFRRNYEPSDSAGTPATRGHCATSGDRFVNHEFCADRGYELIAQARVQFAVWERQGPTYVQVGDHALGVNDRLTMSPALDRLLIGNLR